MLAVPVNFERGKRKFGEMVNISVTQEPFVLVCFFGISVTYNKMVTDDFLLTQLSGHSSKKKGLFKINKSN